MIPSTPSHPRNDFRGVIRDLNEKYGLDIPIPYDASPTSLENKTTPPWLCYKGLRRLYFDRRVNLRGLVQNFGEWTDGRSTTPLSRQADIRQRSEEPRLLSDHETEERTEYLVKLIKDELYLLSKGSVADTRFPKNPIEDAPKLSPKKRRFSGDEDEFHTAPNSPMKEYEGDPSTLEFSEVDFSAIAREPTSHAASPFARGSSETTAAPSAFVQKLKATQPDLGPDVDAVPAAMNRPVTSFSTRASSVFTSHGASKGNSFDTDITEMTQSTTTQSTYGDSVVGAMLSDEFTRSMEAAQSMANEGIPTEMKSSAEVEIINELVRSGPFSIAQTFQESVPLRYRFELERIGRAWNVPLDRMLCGPIAPFKTQEAFWSWINRHGERKGCPLPERSSRRAWDAAVGDFGTDGHSEVVVLTGDLDWCKEGESGIFKLRLNPLKPERSCRFHRRFGSDRFLTLTLPAPSRPPRHLMKYASSQPSVLRESIALWLAHYDHQCLGRTWRPFYVEEVKSKRKTKTEPRFRVELFAINGVDFDDNSPATAPRKPSEKHSPMGLKDLLDWHMAPAANRDQSNCKLFQRISLGLSKTFATVTLTPNQIFHLMDHPKRTVMNDGCALMSRAMANKICDRLGITTATPSCFQGRIAGAKGLWMVDRHDSEIGNGVWIQISDSQLKIRPHPQDCKSPPDDEQLTFEVINWAKPLHPVHLNIQLLAILDNRAQVKEYIAKLVRDGIQDLYKDFAEVLRANSPVLCRSLLQKLRPSAEDVASKSRRLDQWKANDAEFIIRMSEAGFGPRSFYPLRVRLRKYLTWLVDRHVEELHIRVPLSTYAYCIADPYGVLEEDEVHFGFSQNWRDPQGQFEDNLLDGVDVLVGRLPAHVPSDIQRRRAVWKPRLRHFKDVIVFPTKGKTPLAHMLSGGDYDGDTPWICWDPKIVQNFENSAFPSSEEYPVQHFGLAKHSVPMGEMQSVEEFLRSTFAFNLRMSNLGRCTIEHEKIAYDESIDSPKAKELACLLSHLVDGRKGGVHLSEQAWHEYRKTISPKQRAPPAYRNSDRKYKPSNIVDYLKFVVAETARREILIQLERTFPENDYFRHTDEDLARPWREALKAAEIDDRKGGSLRDVLAKITATVEELYDGWNRSLHNGTAEFSPIARETAANAAALLPPALGTHPLVHTWQQSHDEWMRLLASYTYQRRPCSSFVIHTFGEILCELKAVASPSRSITHDVLACYRVNQKTVAHHTALELPGEDAEDADAEEYEGVDAVEVLLFSGWDAVEYFNDLDDGMSVE